ncbi:MAG: hypothetical protein COV57_01955 [Candidatus Liptonbacteria bacterium CG11_big_fil_rev_8_21_14_0_20_35_14]|uniref:Uncharacterized protein n=1 Tax=Candidatus Liptonbacteria bacterium CG11_big_fil_rev_8_21_14_0_20_35_14 TaxID=1974634 RepID=A0A2H0N7P8_9BACT|nr:MAG: hypothetical protein COV57_01955 [Candidatus Liptonbacteria bacterium CG11_big_fil_rev_8_21_14_0_20_35_14]
MNQERNVNFLMANLGSEVTRLINAKQKGDFKLLEDAKKRALVIWTEIELKENLKERKYELKILREVIEDISKKYSDLNLNYNNVKDYFLPFALRVIG